MNVSWCMSRWLYDETHKSEQCPLCPICASWRARLCVCVGGGVPLSRGNKEHPRKWLGSYPRTPNPVTISP